MKSPPYLVVSGLPGNLYIMPRPSGDSLVEDVRILRLIGINLVVSLLEKEEAAGLGLHYEDNTCAQNQIGFIQFEIQDMGLPEIKPFTKLIEIIVEKLKAGESVATHCRAGIGRSGMVVCCVLLHLGYSAEATIKLVSKAREANVPDTEEQVSFIQMFELMLRDV